MNNIDTEVKLAKWMEEKIQEERKAAMREVVDWVESHLKPKDALLYVEWLRFKKERGL